MEQKLKGWKWVDKQDFPLTKNLSDWVCDLTSANIDGWSHMECEWYIFHITPGHIIVMIHLFEENLKKRIRYPFCDPTNWETRPIAKARWTERSMMFDEFTIKRQELEAQQLILKTCKN